MRLKAIDALPDIFKTFVKVTADMSIAVNVARFAGRLAPSVAGGGYVSLPLREPAD
jgi:hypothetical protein